VAKPEFVGKRVRCSACGGRMVVPAEGEPATPVGAAVAPAPASASATASAPSRAVDDSTDHIYDLADPDGSPTEVNLSGDLPLDAPELGAPRGPRRPGGEDEVESILPSRSESLAELRKGFQSSDEADRRRRKRAASKKKGDKALRPATSLEPGDVQNIFLGTIGTLVVVGGLAWGYPILRPFMGPFLLVFGGLTYMMGTIAFSRVAATEGEIHSVLCKLFPPYALFFLLSRWGKMKEHAVFMLAGAILAVPGWYLFKTSPLFELDEPKKPAAGAGAVPGKAEPGPRAQQEAPPIKPEDDAAAANPDAAPAPGTGPAPADIPGPAPAPAPGAGADAEAGQAPAPAEAAPAAPQPGPAGAQPGNAPSSAAGASETPKSE
jgi:hypothetical protein